MYCTVLYSTTVSGGYCVLYNCVKYNYSTTVHGQYYVLFSCVQYNRTCTMLLCSNAHVLVISAVFPSTVTLSWPRSSPCSRSSSCH